ncbi:cardiolipin synthase [Bacteroidia bacterium]|nr:cardiolipin synthase [Bacteroidia bacterium]
MSTLILCVVIVIYAMSVFTAVHSIVLRNGLPVRTLAWLVVVIFIPLIGLGFYFFFGINYRKTKMFSMKALGDIKWLQYMNEDQKQRIQKVEILRKEDTAGVKKLITLLLNNSKALLTLHNSIDILNNGENTFPAIFEAIASAKKHIHLEFYIVEVGEVTGQLKQLLVAKAREGVEVRFIYDDVGSWKLPSKIVQEMRVAGIQIYPFQPVRFHRLADKANYRDHRKIVVIDGEVAFVGGLNFADRYLHGVPKIGAWRDTHLRVKGEAVASLQIVFLIDWYFVRQELLLNKQEYISYTPESSNVMVQTVTSGPDSDWTSIQQCYFTLINMAKRYVYISTPYFMPGETMLNCLKAAAMGGVDVRVMLPYTLDSHLVYWCSRSFIVELLEAGVKVYWYMKGMNHSKVIVVDGTLASVGTANMDLRSFEQNFEVNLIIYDQQVAKNLETDFMNDLKNSEQESLHRWNSRTKTQKIKESVARLFAPVL